MPASAAEAFNLERHLPEASWQWDATSRIATEEESLLHPRENGYDMEDLQPPHD
jgi:hypothetical protein